MRKLLCMAVLLFAGSAQAEESVTLLNVSYDPTRELYAEYNRAFAATWQKEHGQKLRVRMSHGGSGKQARSVMEGLQADVVTLALGQDVDAIAAKGILAADWESKLPHHSSPYRSTIVFLVRKGNPKKIHDWDDLVRDDVQILTPNPKTSGGARWNYLAAWAYAQRYDEKRRDAFMRGWLRNVKMFDAGARASTTNFVRRKQGDVLITWENEAYVAQKYFGEDTFEIVTPSVSILCEPSVAVVDRVVDARGTRELATTYLLGLYEPAGQKLVAQHFFRPLEGDGGLPPLQNVTLLRAADFGGWNTIAAQHFAEGARFDQFTARGER